MSKIKTIGQQLKHAPMSFIKIIPETGSQVEAWINPKEIAFSKAVGWSEQQGKGTNFPALQFTSGKAITISIELMFDGYESNTDVRGQCEAMLKMAMIDESLHRPPKVEVSWGDKLPTKDFKGVVENVKIRYTMFNPAGIPVRAVATVGLKQADEIQPSGNSPDVAKQRLVKRGETLQSIAESEYRDASQWRRIAEANNIDAPLSLSPGAKLLIPPIL